MDNGLKLWARSRWPAERWRAAARSAICAVVDACRGDDDGLPADILERVDAAYPFDARPPAGPVTPYKAWLAERRGFIAALNPIMPSADEIAACEVARDAEYLGDRAALEAALALAPNRLARRCPVCARAPGWDCVDLDVSINHVFPVLAVPHHARLVGHLDAGPLFTTTRSA